MSEEKLDLILNVVSDIKNRQEGLEKTVGEIVVKIDGLETRFDGLETRFDSLETKVDNLDSEFKDFRKQVTEAFANVSNRFALLEKQMTAIGVEIKAEIKQEVKIIAARIDRLEKQIIYDRNETLENKDAIREIDDRLTKIENHIGL